MPDEIIVFTPVVAFAILHLIVFLIKLWEEKRQRHRDLHFDSSTVHVVLFMVIMIVIIAVVQAFKTVPSVKAWVSVGLTATFLSASGYLLFTRLIAAFKDRNNGVYFG